MKIKSSTLRRDGLQGSRRRWEGGGKGEVLYLLAAGLPGVGQLVNWLSVLRSAKD